MIELLSIALLVAVWAVVDRIRHKPITCEADEVYFLSDAGTQNCLETSTIHCIWENAECSDDTSKALALADAANRKIVDYDMGCALKTVCIKDSNVWVCRGPFISEVNRYVTHQPELCPR